MKLLSKLAMVLVSVAAAGAVVAMPPENHAAKPGPMPLTRAEALARAAERFDAADKNKDGTLSSDELRALHKDRAAEREGRRGDRDDLGHEGRE